ncbi:TFIID-18kDa-domain-containing protein [Jackrogersella minutella]|nr:TFIID-18kDa-domain-containing protein [Jackrogersella minutella]
MEPRARAGKNVGKETFSIKDMNLLLYCFGDVPDPLPETARVLDEIVTEFMEGVCFEASYHAQVAGRQKLKFDDFEFALRRNPQYLGRVKTMVEKRKQIRDFRKVFKMDDEMFAQIGRGKKGGEDDLLLGLDDGDLNLVAGIAETSSKGAGSKKRKRAAK